MRVVARPFVVSTPVRRSRFPVDGSCASHSDSTFMPSRTDASRIPAGLIEPQQATCFDAAWIHCAGKAKQQRHG